MYKIKNSPYEGHEPFAFVSYSHRDSEEVWPILDLLQDMGYRIWFDEGVVPGSEWPAYIEDHLNRCSAVMAFVSPSSVASANCRREITYSLDKQKPLIYVVLKETQLVGGMNLQLAGQYCVNRTLYSHEEMIKKICSAPALQLCRKASSTDVNTNMSFLDGASRKQPFSVKTIAIIIIAIVIVFSAVFLITKRLKNRNQSSESYPSESAVINETSISGNPSIEKESFSHNDTDGITEDGDLPMQFEKKGGTDIGDLFSNSSQNSVNIVGESQKERRDSSSVFMESNNSTNQSIEKPDTSTVKDEESLLEP